MSPKTLPRFAQMTSGGTVADRLVRPLGPTLAGLAAGTPEAQRHAGVAERYGEMRTSVVALGVKLAEAEATDAAGERRALEQGRKVPAKKADAIRDELEEARRQLGVLEDLLAETSVDLLVASVPFLEEAASATRQVSEQALDEVAAHLDAGAAALVHAEAAAGEARWTAELATSGQTAPWSSGRRATPAPHAGALIRQAADALAFDRAEAVERREGAAREREGAAGEKLPPGSLVWRGGQTMIVGADGEVEEVE